MSSVTENNNARETRGALKAENSSRMGRYRNCNNSHPKSYENDFNSPPKVIWHQFWKPHFSWDVELCEVSRVRSLMNIFNSAEALGFWRSADYTWLCEYLRTQWFSTGGESKMVRSLPHHTPITTHVPGGRFVFEAPVPLEVSLET